MDANSKANFINSIADNAKSNVNDATNEPAFKTVAETNANSIEIMDEASSVFAEGLPSWDIVPPQVFVRRKRK